MSTPKKSKPSLENLDPNPFNFGLADKILRFLVAINDDDVARVLVVHGFTSADLEEGWRHLRGLARKDVDGLPPPEEDNANVKLLAELKAWADQWLPIVRAVVTNRLPHLRDHLVGGLPSAQMQKPEKVPADMRAALDIAHLAERILALGKGDAKKREARKLLATRGLTDAMLKDAFAKFERLSDVFAIPVHEQRKVLERDAEQRASQWYLEWSAIARARIQDHRLLRRLGFGKRGRPVGAKTQPRSKMTMATANVDSAKS